MRITVAIALVVALVGVHSALARADIASAPGISRCTLDIDHPCDVLAIEHAAHLAGHLTGIVVPTIGAVVAIDATLRRQPICADALPLSTTLPTPSEPPRA